MSMLLVACKTIPHFAMHNASDHPVLFLVSFEDAPEFYQSLPRYVAASSSDTLVFDYFYPIEVTNVSVHVFDSVYASQFCALGSCDSLNPDSAIERSSYTAAEMKRMNWTLTFPSDTARQ